MMAILRLSLDRSYGCHQAAGSRQIPKCGCGCSSVTQGVQLPGGQARSKGDGSSTAWPQALRGGGGVQPLLSRPVKPWPAFLSLGRWLWSTGEAGSKPPAAAFSERKKAPWLLYRMRFQRLAMGWFRLNENLRDTPEQGLADFLSNGPDSKYFTL